MTIAEQVKAIQALDRLYVMAKQTQRPDHWRRYHEKWKLLCIAMNISPEDIGAHGGVLRAAQRTEAA